MTDDDDGEMSQSKASSKFIASKWETVDPEQLERQGMIKTVLKSL